VGSDLQAMRAMLLPEGDPRRRHGGELSRSLQVSGQIEQTVHGVRQPLHALFGMPEDDRISRHIRILPARGLRLCYEIPACISPRLQGPTAEAGQEGTRA
jgi:hypothetical protein